MIMNKEKIKQAILISVMIFYCVVIFLPLLWCLSTSLRNPAEAFRMPPSFIPTEFDWSNYQDAFSRFPFWSFTKNSLIAAAGSVILNVVVTTMAGFALARIPFRGRGAAFAYLMMGMMVPSSATMVSLFLVMNSINLVNTLWALVLPAMISPLYIFLVRQFMATIPMSYEEAAEMDGCSRFKFFLMIAVPMAKPVIFLSVLRVFIDSWNNFTGALIYLTDWDKMTLTIGLRMLDNTKGNGSISAILAGVVVSLVAPTIVYLVGQRTLVEGIAISGLKA